MSDIGQQHKPTGYTREMREARPASLAGHQEGQQAGTQEPQAGQNAVGTQEPSADTLPHGITRENRKPFGSTNQKLAYPARPGYHRHWFNDNPGRVDGAAEAGYTHVQNARGQNEQRVVGTREGGHPINAFLMEIPQEWFDDDMQRYEDQTASKEQAILKGNVEKATPQDSAKFYPTAQGRKISLTRR